MTTHDNKTAADLLAEVGRALFDDDWPSRLALALGVERNTLRNWLRGRSQFGPDHGALDDLLALAERRAEEAVRARDELKGWLKRNRPPATSPGAREPPS
jgi:transposase-like protein